jgi:drug/metabolite transporter (DMT)-like permease
VSLPPSLPPTDRPASEAQTWALFLALAAIWASSFLFIKMLLQDGVPPLTIVLYRTLFGSLLLGAILVVAGDRLRLSLLAWRRMAFLGLTNVVIPYALIAWGQQYIPSGMASILNALVPIFTFLLAAVVLHDERLTLTRAGGLVVGFAGVVLLALPSFGAAIEDAQGVLAVEGMLAVALGGVSYAVAAVYSRRRLTGQPIVSVGDGSLRTPTAHEIALGSTLVGFVVVGALALLVERPAGGLLHVPVSPGGWIGMLWLGALGTGLAYLLFFTILDRWGATRTTLVTYVLPVAAITLGFIFLGERLQPIELAGAALVIGGVVLVNGTLGRRVRRGAVVAGPVVARPDADAGS